MSDAVRAAFAEDIAELQQDLLKMASVVEQMLHKSIEALITRNKTLADDAIALDDVVDDYNLSIENRCLKLLALQQPMAGDLRTIAAGLKIITDIERMGDYVVDIAKTAKRLADEPAFSPPDGIPVMVDLVKKMLRDSLTAFISRDLGLIESMIQDDDRVDELNHSLRAELVSRMQRDPSIVSQGVSMVLITRYLERLADHVTNVGERVYYMETGEMKELH